jgi:hypothetical protein
MLHSGFRLVLATIVALSLALRLAVGPPIAHAGYAAIRIFHQGHPVHLLAPGAGFVVVVAGIGEPHNSYCLGLASLRDRYGLPVSLGVFRPVDDGVMAVQATVPLRVFPAEPPGPFLLFVGRCTNVAPDGNYGSATVTIVPAAG